MLDNVFVLRVAAGFGVFALVGLAALPLSWMAGSRLALIALLAAQLAFSFYAGRAISARLLARGAAQATGEDGAPLRPRGDLGADFCQWVLLSFGALMFLLVAPLLVFLVASLVIELSQQEMKWLAGPFAEGTGVQVAYVTLPAALAAAFVEVFILHGSGITGAAPDRE